jgi:N-acyl-D-amino-acid deacylase
MLTTHFRATVSMRAVNSGVISNAIGHTQSCIASNSAAFGKKEFKTIQSIRTFPEFFEYSEKKKCMSRERAIAKTTSIPAHILGIKKRGVLAEGNYADVVIWDNNEPVNVYVNGECVWSKEKGFGGRRQGVILQSNV